MSLVEEEGEFVEELSSENFKKLQAMQYRKLLKEIIGEEEVEEE